VVGKDSVLRQSRLFQPPTDTMFRRHAVATVSAAVREKAKTTASAEASSMPPPSRNFRPIRSISQAARMFPGRFAADTRKASW
jgi:hypothetical protein